MIRIIVLVVLAVYLVTFIESRTPFPDKTNSAFNTECLKYHNMYRKRHKAPPLRLNNNLVKYAKQRLAKITKSQGLAHAHSGLNPKYGENIFKDKADDKTAYCKEAIKKWYEEKKWYSFALSKFVAKTGHFTQLVWAATREVGCARSIKRGKPKNEIYIDCIYKVSGNTEDQMRKNVKQ